MFGGWLVWALALKPDSWARSLLGSGVLVFFGKYSYGLYVVHGMLTPMFLEWLPVESWISAFGSVPFGSIACTLARIAISVALALASWHLFEKQFLKLKRYFEYQKPRRKPTHADCKSGAEAAPEPVLA
jgi:peptidoglycan/LPS O-acetylase OafA/YrhL